MILIIIICISVYIADNEDYYYETSNIIIPAGVTSFSFGIQIYNDDTIEDYETFDVYIYYYYSSSNDPNIIIGNHSRTTVTIVDDDCEYVIII